MKALSEITSSKVRSELFRVLFGAHDEELRAREIEKRSGFSIGSIQAELKKFRTLDLVKTRGVGNRLYCIANRENPLYWDIHNLVMKTTGLADILGCALQDQPDIHSAFIFGPAARQKERPPGDVDIMIIGAPDLKAAARRLSEASRRIGRRIKPHVLDKSELIARKESRDPFILQVLEAPKIFIVGNENDLDATG